MKNWQKIAVVFVIIALSGAGFLMNSWMQAANANACTNTTIADYNRGYLQAVQDIVTLAYTNGVVKIPFNETFNYALMPWNGVNR